MRSVSSHQCPLCSSSCFSGGELPHATIGVCKSQECACRFAVIKDYGEQDLAQIHLKIREQGAMDSPASVFRRVLPKLSLVRSFPEHARLLDFGCGAAPLYPIARQYGFEYTGVEFDDSARAEALARYGITLGKDLHALPTGSTYDLIIMSEVIEHLPDPVSVLSLCRQRLKSNGLLYISTPDARSLRARVEGPRWVNYQNRAHVFYFSETSLRLTLNKAGFRSIDRFRVFVPYPSHSSARRLVQRILVVLGWDGALRVVARP